MIKPKALENKGSKSLIKSQIKFKKLRAKDETNKHKHTKETKHKKTQRTTKLGSAL